MINQGPVFMQILPHCPTETRVNAFPEGLAVMKLQIIPASKLLICAMLLACASSYGVAQTAQPNPSSSDQPPDPQLKISPLKALQNFEPPIGEEYELGPGDDISIDVPGHPELSGKHTIGPDGRVSLPVAGAVDLSNKTRETASKAIADALSTYYQNPAVTVSVDRYGSNHILILGNVQHPGVLNYEGTPTLLDAIARGGLLASSTSKDAIPERCYIYRGNDQRMEVDIKQLLQSGSAVADLRLRRNDIIFVPLQQEEFISVLGQVQHPGAVPLSQGLTLRLAIAQSGGFADAAGSSPNIQVVSAVTNKTTIVPFKELSKPNGDAEVTLHPGDMVIVPKSGFEKVSYVFTKITSFATLVTIGALLH